MALRFMDGFDHYAVPADIPRKYTSYNDSGSSIGLTGITGRRAGSTALQLRVSIDYVSLTLDDQQTWIVGFAVNLSGSEGTDLVRFYDNTGAVQAALAISSGGMLQLYRGGTLLATATTALAINTWAYIETKLTIADSGGVFEARLNESVVVTFTGDTKQSSTINTANRIYFVGRGSKNAIDDLYICDGTGTVNNGYLGDCRVDSLKPVGVGTYAEFTPQGAASNWDCVDEVPYDVDATYNATNVTGKRDSFDCSNLAAIAGAISGVMLSIMARKDDAGSRSLRSLTRVGGADYEGATIPVGTDYRYALQVVEQNPNTSTAWTDTAINGAEFGYKLQA